MPSTPALPSGREFPDRKEWLAEKATNKLACITSLATPQVLVRQEC
jgi:hypothetical protein